MNKKLLLPITILSLITSSIYADNNVKRSIKGNMNLVYHDVPQEAENINEVFEKAKFYGRLRSNIFIYDWDTESSSRKDHQTWGLGGSIVMKTAPLNGISATIGAYTAQNPALLRPAQADVGFAKSGKDVFARGKVRDGDGEFGMNVIAESYLEANINKSTIKLGRQMIHTVFTKSNDTKMIPNSFDAITVSNKSLQDTKLKAAFITAHKLRDHVTSHDVITNDGWAENDDSATNKSLTTDVVGIDNKMIIIEAKNKSIENLALTASYLQIPDVFFTSVIEANYNVGTYYGWNVKPSARIVMQVDELNSSTNVACLKGSSADKVTGYTNPTSLDGGAKMARVDLSKDALRVRFGYSQIDDKADILAMWRGFITGGYTRAMAQYNWYANTKTYMTRIDYNFKKAGINAPIDTILARYAIQDFDDSKTAVQADSNVIHIDMVKKIEQYPGLEAKIRLGLVDAYPENTGKSDVSYNEYRFELNYLF